MFSRHLESRSASTRPTGIRALTESEKTLMFSVVEVMQEDQYGRAFIYFNIRSTYRDVLAKLLYDLDLKYHYTVGSSIGMIKGDVDHRVDSVRVYCSRANFLASLDKCGAASVESTSVESRRPDSSGCRIS